MAAGTSIELIFDEFENILVLSITNKTEPELTIDDLGIPTFRFATNEVFKYDFVKAIAEGREDRDSNIYDALHLQAAIKADADVLYTDNLSNFSRLMTDDVTFTLEGVR